MAWFYSQHPALVVFTDGVNFVILQPWGHAIQYYHTFYGTGDCVSVLDAMRFIAHHLLHISKVGAFKHLALVPENTELSMEIAPLLVAKRELGEGDGLADQLWLDQDLPPDKRLEAVSNIILALSTSMAG